MMKKFVRRFFGIVSAVLALTIIYNLVRDTTGILRHSGIDAEHFVKMRYILSEKEKYDAFCFGSSRVGNIDLTRIKDGRIYYNMTYAQGVAEEWLYDIKMLTAKGVKIKRLMLGIDDFSFRVDPKTHESQITRIPYKENNCRAYFSVALTQPRWSDIKELLKKEKTSDAEEIYDIYGTGRPLKPAVDRDIAADYQNRIKQGKFAKSNRYLGNRIKESIAALKEIKNIAAEQGVELTIWINPVHHLTYLTNDLDEFNEFKRQLASITDYWDFSGLNAITENDYYWYETSHFRVCVGDMIIDRLSGRENKDPASKNFGEFVTAENVESHIRRLKEREAGRNP